MVALNFQKIVNLFLNGETDARSSAGGNLKISGDLLIHFNTTIAQRVENKIIINITRYSIITGRLQKILMSSADAVSIQVVKKIPKNYDKALIDFSQIKE